MSVVHDLLPRTSGDLKRLLFGWLNKGAETHQPDQTGGLMIPQSELNAEAIRMMMQEVAQEHRPFEADGYICCTSEMIYDVL